MFSAAAKPTPSMISRYRSFIIAAVALVSLGLVLFSFFFLAPSGERKADAESEQKLESETVGGGPDSSFPVTPIENREHITSSSDHSSNGVSTYSPPSTLYERKEQVPGHRSTQVSDFSRDNAKYLTFEEEADESCATDY